jgi:hypothetical protein
MSSRFTESVRDPVTWTNASQLLKTVGAAVIAWVLAAHVFDIAGTLRAGREPAVDEWIARSNDLHEDIDESWQVLGQARESGRLNPRRVKVPRPPALSAR